MDKIEIGAYEKETWKPLVWSLIAQCVLILASFLALGPVWPEWLLVKVVFLIVALGVMFVAWVIDKRERIYWITTYTYETAKKMTQQERKRIAEKMLRITSYSFGAFIIYLIIGMAIGTSVIVDVIAFVIASIALCIWG